MRYCLRCGEISSEDSNQTDNECGTCGYKLTIDEMNSEKYNLLSEQEKDEYELKLLKTIQNSPMFDERLYNMYNKYGTANFYYYFRFDKYEQMTGKKAGRKMTKEESDDLKQHLQETYGKGSKLYEEQVVQNCIEADRARKQKKENIPHCPICNSTNIKKITLSKRALKTAIFGIVGAIDDSGKTYKCNNCDSRF